MGLKEEDLQTFADWGLVQIKNLIPSKVALAARDYVYGRLSKAGLWADGRWTIAKPEVDATWVVPDERQKKTLSGVSSSRLFKELLTPDVLATARQFVGGDELIPTPPYTQFLFTPPNAHQWRLPHSMWHIDFPRTGDVGWAGVQVFTFLQRLEPGGGGSVMVAGSHQLLNDAGIIPSKTFRRRLARAEYFRALMDKNDSDRQRFLKEVAYINDTPLKVVELIGEPGDVYIADLRLLHSVAPNTANLPRMMVTQRLLRASVAEQMQDVYATINRRRQARRERRGKK